MNIEDKWKIIVHVIIMVLVAQARVPITRLIKRRGPLLSGTSIVQVYIGLQHLVERDAP